MKHGEQNVNALRDLEHEVAGYEEVEQNILPSPMLQTQCHFGTKFTETVSFCEIYSIHFFFMCVLVVVVTAR